MNKKTSFIFGFIFALCFSGIGWYIMSKEVARINESSFMLGYVLEVSTLAALISEKDDQKREDVTRFELCEAIGVIGGSIEKGGFSTEYFELLASKSVGDYQTYIAELETTHCGGG